MPSRIRSRRRLSTVRRAELTPVFPRRNDIEVSYIRDPGAITVQDPSTGLWQGRMITPDILAPETLRYAAARSQVYNTILKNFQREVARFARRPQFDGDVGFSVVPELRNHHMTLAEEKEAMFIEDFLLNTGRFYNPRRRDKMRQYMIKQVYNTCVYDRMATKLVWQKAVPFEFECLDGATIIRVDTEVYIPQTERGRAVAPISYIQIHKDQVWAEFNDSELIFGIRNPSPSLDSNGYGIPEIQDLIEPITIEILILTYIDRILTQGSIPEGLLILKSARTGQAIDSIAMSSGQVAEDFERVLRNQVAGANNAGRLAVLRLRGNEEAQLILNDHDLAKMPFIQTYEIVQNQIAKKMGVDPADVGIVTGSIKQSFTDNDQKNAQMRQTRTRAVTNLLMAMADTQLNPIIKYLNPNFCIKFHGIDTQLEQERLNLESLQMNMGLLTLNNVLNHQNLEMYPKDEKHWWADIPLHPMIFEAVAAERGLQVQKKDAQKGGGGVGGEAGQRKPGSRSGNGNDSGD